MSKENIYCVKCRFLHNEKCFNVTSDFYDKHFEDENIKFDECKHKFSVISSENDKNQDEDTGELL
jgi:hypothetical protein